MEETNPQDDQTTELEQDLLDLQDHLQIEIFDVEEHEGGAVVQLSGEIDMATAQNLVTAFQEVADRLLTEVIIDLSRVTFMDTTGLHALIQGKTRVHEIGARIVLIPSPQVKRVLELVLPEPLFAARVDTMEKAREVLGWD